MKGYSNSVLNTTATPNQKQFMIETIINPLLDEIYVNTPSEIEKWDQTSMVLSPDKLNLLGPNIHKYPRIFAGIRYWFLPQVFIYEGMNIEFVAGVINSVVKMILEELLSVDINGELVNTKIFEDMVMHTDISKIATLEDYKLKIDEDDFVIFFSLYNSIERILANAALKHLMYFCAGCGVDLRHKDINIQ